MEAKLRELVHLMEAKHDDPRVSQQLATQARVCGALRAAVRCCTKEAVSFTPKTVTYALRVVSTTTANSATNRSYLLLSGLVVPLVDVLSAGLVHFAGTNDIESLASEVRIQGPGVATWLGSTLTSSGGACVAGTQTTTDCALVLAAMHALWLLLRHEPASVAESEMRNAITKYA